MLPSQRSWQVLCAAAQARMLVPGAPQRDRRFDVHQRSVFDKKERPRTLIARGNAQYQPSPGKYSYYVNGKELKAKAAKCRGQFPFANTSGVLYCGRPLTGSTREIHLSSELIKLPESRTGHTPRPAIGVFIQSHCIANLPPDPKRSHLVASAAVPLAGFVTC